MASEFYDCDHNSRAHRAIIRGISASQAGAGRHKCAACAFHLGQKNARKGMPPLVPGTVAIETCNHGNMAPIAILDFLPISQADEHRHKCCVCAYAKGYYYELASEDRENLGAIREVIEKVASSIRVEKIQAPWTKDSIGGKSHVMKSRAKPVAKISPYVQPDKSIGLLGELLILKFERNRLINEGFPRLAKKVEHVALTQSDGAGYDILSFSAPKFPRYIEVKTTKGDMMAPFYITSNELAFSKANTANYHIYRVSEASCNKKTAPKLAIQVGDVESWCRIEPVQYRAKPNRR